MENSPKLPPGEAVVGTPPVVAPGAATAATGPARHKFAQTVPGIILVVLAVLGVLVGKSLLATHALAGGALVLVSLLYVGYFLWARGAKIQTRALTGMDAVRDKEREGSNHW